MHSLETAVVVAECTFYSRRVYGVDITHHAVNPNVQNVLFGSALSVEATLILEATMCVLVL